MISDLGERHPVTEGLEQFAPREPVNGIPGWGRWFRLVDTVATSGHVVMEGYEGGGPQLELLRRLAHWLMKEPELEEEVLTATSDGSDVVVTRRTMGESAQALTVTGPDGEEQTLALTEVSPGRFEAQFQAAENGLYRLKEGQTSAVVAVGPSAPKEFENPISTGEILEPMIEATRGGVFRLEDGFPDLRMVRDGRVAAGRGWMGLSRRDAYNVIDIKLTPLAPGWLMLLLAAGFAVLAWRVEGR